MSAREVYDRAADMLEGLSAGLPALEAERAEAALAVAKSGDPDNKATVEAWRKARDAHVVQRDLVADLSHAVAALKEQAEREERSARSQADYDARQREAEDTAKRYEHPLSAARIFDLTVRASHEYAVMKHHHGIEPDYVRFNSGMVKYLVPKGAVRIGAGQGEPYWLVNDTPLFTRWVAENVKMFFSPARVQQAIDAARRQDQLKASERVVLPLPSQTIQRVS